MATKKEVEVRSDQIRDATVKTVDAINNDFRWGLRRLGEIEQEILKVGHHEEIVTLLLGTLYIRSNMATCIKVIDQSMRDLGLPKEHVDKVYKRIEEWLKEGK